MEPVTNQEQMSRQGSRKRCSHCGASNKQDAGWCGQCLEKFEETDDLETQKIVATPNPSAEDNEGEAGSLADEDAALLLSSLAADTLTSMKAVDRPASQSPQQPRVHLSQSVKTATRPTTDGSNGAFQVGEEGITWTCLKCESVNPMEARSCSVCGTNFAAAIQPEEKDEGPPKDPNKAAMVSLAIPGAGHAYLGMWPEGIARAVLSLWVVAVFIFTAAQGAGTARIMSFLFGSVAFALWVVGAHDSYREASGMPKSVLLKRKYFLHLVLGLLVMSIAMIFSAAVAAGR